MALNLFILAFLTKMVSFNEFSFATCSTMKPTLTPFKEGRNRTWKSALERDVGVECLACLFIGWMIDGLISRWRMLQNIRELMQ